MFLAWLALGENDRFLHHPHFGHFWWPHSPVNTTVRALDGTPIYKILISTSFHQPTVRIFSLWQEIDEIIPSTANETTPALT